MKFFKIWLNKFMIWKEERNFRKEVEQQLQIDFGTNFTLRSFLGDTLSNELDSFRTGRIIQEDNQYKYREGIRALKRNLKRISGASSEEELDGFLKQIDDMMIYAAQESQDTRIIRAIRESLIVRKGIDVKTKKDKENRAKERVEDFKGLQDNIEKRNLQRRIRRFQKEGKTELVKQLTKEFEEKYGNN